MVSDTNHLMSHFEISRLNKSLFPLKCEVNIKKPLYYSSFLFIYQIILYLGVA